MTIFELLQQTGLPCAYSHFSEEDSPSAPPYIVYLGDGQNNFRADDTFYHQTSRYQIEYYFSKKDEGAEARIEKVLLDNGYLYEKSEDVYIESEDVFVIYYNI